MIRVAHLLIVAVYVALPAVLFLRALIIAVRHHRRLEMQRFYVTASGGLVMGVVICSVFAMIVHGPLTAAQIFLAAYFATGLLFILKAFDRSLWLCGQWAFRLRARPGSRWSYNLRAFAALSARAVILFAVGLPYMLAAVLTYRPRVAPVQTPKTLFNWSFEDVQFPATDETRLSGWWIPAARGSGSRTVIFCHGLAGGKASQLFLVRRLVEGGYNVLAFDFRAHGQSDGQITSFGDLERKDVLGAVRWLCVKHPEACERVVGLGVSTGAAALVSAAADPGTDGQHIDAVAVYGSFARLESVLQTTTTQYTPFPVNWLLQHVGLPLASLQSGADLAHFDPAQEVKALWPRPILVIHGIDDEIIPFDAGQSLYDAAFQPKYNDWIDRAGHLETLLDAEAGRRVKRFFDEAERII